MSRPSRAAPATDPLDEPSTHEPLVLEVPPLDDDGVHVAIDAGTDALDLDLDRAADAHDDEAGFRGDFGENSEPMIGDEASSLGDEAMSLADEPVDGSELVEGDERGLLKDSDEPDGRDVDAHEAGIDAVEESSADDGGAEGPSEAIEAVVDDRQASLWDRLGRREREALRAIVGERTLSAMHHDAGGVVVALVDDGIDRCTLVALDGASSRTIAEVDVAGAGEVRALAIDGGDLVLSLARAERRVARSSEGR